MHLSRGERVERATRGKAVVERLELYAGVSDFPGRQRRFRHFQATVEDTKTATFQPIDIQPDGHPQSPQSVRVRQPGRRTTNVANYLRVHTLRFEDFVERTQVVVEKLLE